LKKRVLYLEEISFLSYLVVEIKAKREKVENSASRDVKDSGIWASQAA
jgi:hypothetical protein